MASKKGGTNNGSLFFYHFLNLLVPAIAISTNLSQLSDFLPGCFVLLPILLTGSLGSPGARGM